MAASSGSAMKIASIASCRRRSNSDYRDWLFNSYYFSGAHPYRKERQQGLHHRTAKGCRCFPGKEIWCHHDCHKCEERHHKVWFLLQIQQEEDNHLVYSLQAFEEVGFDSHTANCCQVTADTDVSRWLTNISRGQECSSKGHRLHVVPLEDQELVRQQFHAALGLCLHKLFRHEHSRTHQPS